jgi:hypothetical protein
VQGLDFILELFYQIQICGCDLSVVGLDVRVFLGVLGGELLNFIVFFIFKLLD